MAEDTVTFSDSEPILPTCRKCNEPISEWDGTGRKPTMHDRCKVRNASTRDGKGRFQKRERLRKSNWQPTMPLDQLEEKLFESFAGMGIMVMSVNRFDGIAIMLNADKQSETLRQLAETNEVARRACEGFVTTSTMGAVIMAFAPTVIPILMNHGVVKGNPAMTLGMMHKMSHNDPTAQADLRAMVDQMSSNLFPQKDEPKQQEPEQRSTVAPETMVTEPLATV